MVKPSIFDTEDIKDLKVIVYDVHLKIIECDEEEK